MKNNITKKNFFTASIILSIFVGLSGCSNHYKREPQIKVQDFVKIGVENGNLAFSHGDTKQKLEVLLCGPEYKNRCPSSGNGFLKKGSQKETVTFTLLEKQTNSVDCFIVIELRGLPPIHLTWHESGDQCSQGNPL